MGEIGQAAVTFAERKQEWLNGLFEVRHPALVATLTDAAQAERPQRMTSYRRTLLKALPSSLRNNMVADAEVLQYPVWEHMFP